MLVAQEVVDLVGGFVVGQNRAQQGLFGLHIVGRFAKAGRLVALDKRQD